MEITTENQTMYIHSLPKASLGALLSKQRLKFQRHLRDSWFEIWTWLHFFQLLGNSPQWCRWAGDKSLWGKNIFRLLNMIQLLYLLKIAACYGEVRVCKNKWSQLSSLSAPAWFANTSQSCPATDSVQTTKVSCWDSRASHTSQWLSGRIRDQTTRDLQHSSAKKLSPRLCYWSNSL